MIRDEMQKKGTESRRDYNAGRKFKEVKMSYRGWKKVIYWGKITLRIRSGKR
jgi:hypothetical protein